MKHRLIQIRIEYTEMKDLTRNSEHIDQKEANSVKETAVAMAVAAFTERALRD